MTSSASQINDPLVTVIIPTFDNAQYLQGCLESLLTNQTTKGLFNVLVINNGDPRSCDWVKHPQVKVINSSTNLGWEGGIDLGLNNTTTPFVVFCNDDVYFPPCSRLWLNQLLQHMKDPKVGAVGPSSNVVMGMQNIFINLKLHQLSPTFLIGFCVLMRRSAFEEIGGMDTSLPGGDDLDWSIRLRDAGYKLIADREVFVYHHGFKTGERVEGPASARNGWNSYEKTERTNLALIKKHGLRKWWETLKGVYELPSVKHYQVFDVEGKIIGKLVKPSDRLILDLGCGDNKTIKRAVGVDQVRPGEIVHALTGDPLSTADMQADVSEPLPYPDNSVDVIIARHILEHMVDPITAITYWIAALRPGGRLIIAVPNQDWVNSIPMNYEHLHAYNPVSLQILLTSMGLKIVSVHDAKNRISFVVEAEKPE